MGISLIIGNRDPFAVSSLKDLKSDVDTLLHLGDDFQDWLDKPISALPKELQNTGISYTSGNQSWTAGDFTFSLCGGATGKISIATSGSLLSYTDEFPTEVSVGDPAAANKKNTKAIAVPAGAAYVAVSLTVKLKGGISATLTSGIYGVCGSVNDSDTFTVTFSKKCLPADILSSALKEAIAGFVLPLHAETLNNLEVGDYLHYNFNGCLQVGLGASVGLNKVLYAGQYTADLPTNAGALAVTGSVSPTVHVGANLAFKLEYAGTFEALLWKDADVTGLATGRLHLYRSTEQDKSLGATFGMTLAADPTICVKAVTEQVNGLLTQSVPQGDTLAGKASAEIASFAGDAANTLTSWLTSKTQVGSSLEVAIGSTQQTFLLLDYTFDLSAAAFASGWSAAYGARFMDALQTPDGGVSIAVGSGIEKLYSRTTSVTLCLFGKLKASWDNSVLDNSSMVYAGNNTFHLIADEGRQTLSSLGKSGREIDLYFAAEADLSAAALPLGAPQLHLILKAVNNAKFGNYIAGFLGLMTADLGSADVASIVATLKAAAAKGGTQTLQVVLPSAAYRRLGSSTITHGKPDNQGPDQDNFNAFGTACSELFDGEPANFSYGSQRLGYSTWSNWNIACIDRWPPSSDGELPDRTQTGNPASGLGYLNLQFPQGGANSLAGYALGAVQDFMNLCEALKTLAQAAEVEANQGSWNALVARMKSIIANDVSPDFLASTGLGLVRLCAVAPPAVVVGPVGSGGRVVGVVVRYL
ncbi:hypothetical protein [Acidicapsa ligni]|uniref:hypothetical protein n=1 Tax=Acidicapsa ligni TaxID=542300 RepID=UPI0021E064EA|nr:hypothetical protein [Acidicapsa ligni]